MEKLLRKITPQIGYACYHYLLAFLGAMVYDLPSRELKVIGVTGTNGKSSVVFLISRILEQAGYEVASVSSIQFKIKNKTRPNELKMTMPGRFVLQKFIRQAVDAGCQYLVLEVTSEGIKQYRHKFIEFQTAVITNLSREHIESHGGFISYRKAKEKLFACLGNKDKAVINLDEPNFKHFSDAAGKAEKWFYTLKDKSSQEKDIIKAEALKNDSKGIRFKAESTFFSLKLFGKFNAYNALAAITVGLSENIKIDKIKQAIESVNGIPGRFEFVTKTPFTTIVDYAHTPDALKKVYQTAAGIKKYPEAKIIGILGAAGGGRDKWKRSKMGQIASEYCDYILLTNEDPYDEKPQKILADIKKGIKNFNKANLYEIVDREEAIAKALGLAYKNDIVVITGKGCEPWMCLAQGKKIPWDDRKIVRENNIKK